MDTLQVALLEVVYPKNKNVFAGRMYLTVKVAEEDILFSKMGNPDTPKITFDVNS